jgi:hypothetical protein
MTVSPVFINDAGIPDAVVSVLVDARWPCVCDYASVKRDGTPITVPLGAFPGENKRTIGISTGVAHPAKAERARANPKVALLYAEPKGLPMDNPPVVLVYGEATVRDSDLQANLDRMVRETMARVAMSQKMPKFMIRWMGGYMTRIWIEIMPLKILWWPDADLDKAPQVWHAPEGTSAPRSDPRPKPRDTPRTPLVAPPSDWRKEAAFAIEHFQLPTLTVVGQDGYPVPFKVCRSVLEGEGIRVELPAGAPVEPAGRACMTFSTIQVRNGEMVGNDSRNFLGDAIQDGDGLFFKVKRPLATMSAKMDSLSGILHFIAIVRESARRAKVEAARRDQPVPKVRL